MGTTASPVAALVLAAGSGMRFGGGKVRAQLEGRPSWPTCCRWPGRAGIERLVLVVGRDAAAIRFALLASDPKRWVACWSP